MNCRARRCAIGALALFLSPPACAPPSPGAAARIVATYEGGELTAAELEGWTAFRPMITAERSQMRFGLDPAELAALVKRTAAEAESLGLDADPRIRFEALRDESAILARALKRHVIEALPIDDAEVESLLEQHDGDRRKPERRQLRMILKRTPPAGGEDARARVREEIRALRRRLVAGEDFAELARQESDSQTRHQGGRLGTFEREALPPALAAPAFALDEGEISDVLESPRGFVLLRCERIVAARTMPVEEARERIIDSIRRREGEQAWNDKMAELVGGGADHDLVRLADAGGELDEVLTRFEGGEVTRREVLWIVDRPAPAPEDALLSERDVIRLVDAYVRQRLAAREAKRLGLDASSEVKNEIEWSRRSLLMKAYRDRAVDREFVPPDEAAVRAFFDRHPERFTTAPRYRLAVLWDGSPPEERSDRYLAMSEAVSKIELGELSFGEAARTLSSHPAADRDGEIGWRSRRQVGAWGPAALRTVTELSVGEVSPVIEEPGALWVFKLLELEKPRALSWEEARGQAREGLEAQIRSSLYLDLLARLEDEWEIRMVDAPATG